MLRKLAGIVLGVCASASTLLAQGTWTPQKDIDKLPRGASTQQEMTTLGWIFHPITDGTQVTAFFAELDGADAFGANVKQMYFLRDSMGEWTSYGWADSNTDGAIAWVRSQHGSAALGRDTTYSTAPVTSATPVAPAMMKGGIFVDDPNAAIFDQMDPDARASMIGWLVDAGYAASPKLAELLITEYEGGPKVLDELMNYLANQADYTLYPLKTTYAATTAAAWPCGCVRVRAPSTTLPTPGPIMLDPDYSPNPRLNGGGYCIWRFRRATTTPTLTRSGEWLIFCNSCKGTFGEVWEYTEVTAPCGGGTPTPGPGDYWNY